MAKITVHYRDGSQREFREEARPGGSYSNAIKVDGSFIVITDVWENRTYIPESLIARVEEEPKPRC